MNNEEHDDLWQFLGRAKTPVGSPFFSRNVLRAIRRETQERPGVFAWLRLHRRLTAVSTCVAAIAWLALSPQTDDPDTATMLLAEQVSQSPDYQVINHLDELLESEENSVWLEN